MAAPPYERQGAGVYPEVAGPLLAHNNAWYLLTELRQVDAVRPPREETL
jgi:hypothetical protein